MKSALQKEILSASFIENKSESLLVEKMGMSKEEIHEVYAQYGVTASRLVELMQLSKYQFVYTGKTDGQCEPCMILSKLRPAI